MLRVATLFTLTLLGGAATALWAQSPERGDWAVSSWEVKRLPSLPAGIDLRSLDLDYENADSVIGESVDLNADGRADLLLRSAPSLCGASGNCSFVIIEGKTHRSLGTIGGNRLYIRHRQINTWPVIQSWWHMSAGSGIYSTYVFDGTQYVLLAAVPVEGDGLLSLFPLLDSVKARPHE